NRPVSPDFLSRKRLRYVWLRPTKRVAQPRRRNSEGPQTTTHLLRRWRTPCPAPRLHDRLTLKGEFPILTVDFNLGTSASGQATRPVVSAGVTLTRDIAVTGFIPPIGHGR